MDISIKVTVPETVFNDKVFVAKLTRVMNSKTAPEVKRLFWRTAAWWEHEVHFQHRQRTTRSSISVSIFPTGGNAWLYTIINNGSDRHITSHTGRMMRFQTGYNASTKRGVINSKKYSRSGNWRGAWSVHQIIEPRKFDKTIADWYEKYFVNDVRNVIAEVAQEHARSSN